MGSVINSVLGLYLFFGTLYSSRLCCFGWLVSQLVGQSANWLVRWVGETAEISSGELGEGLAEVECVLPLGF